MTRECEIDRFTEKGQFLGFVKANYLYFIVFGSLGFTSAYFQGHSTIMESVLIGLLYFLIIHFVFILAYWICRLSDKMSNQNQITNKTAPRQSFLLNDVKKLYLWGVIFVPIGCVFTNAVIVLFRGGNIEIFQMGKIVLVLMGLCFFTLTLAVLFWTIIEAWARRLDKK